MSGKRFAKSLLISTITFGPVPEALAQNAATADAPVTVPGAVRFDLRSKNGAVYRIFVAGPSGGVPAAGSPVVYLSDGNGNFPLVLAAAQRQARGELRAVVVGIGYPSEFPGAEQRDQRSFDLTPAAAPGAATSPSGKAAPVRSGGNDLFLTFIEEELKPEIEKRYKIDRTKQTLFGHSFGGLFALHVLFSKPEAFQNYVAVSPSIWWNNGSVTAEEKVFVERNTGREVNARLFLSVGEWELNPPAGVPKERAGVLERFRKLGTAKEMADRLTSAHIKGLSVTYREFPEEEHGSVPLPAASRGVRFALEGK